MLYPPRKPLWFWLIPVALFIAVLVLLGPVLTPFIVAAILAYVLNPGVDWLTRRRIGKWRISRVWASLFVMLLTGGVLMLLVLIVIPVLQKEWPLLQEKFPSFFARLTQWLGPQFQALGIDIQLDFESIKQMMNKQFASSREEIARSILTSARVGGAVLLGWLANLFLIPIVLFYLLVDWPMLLQRVTQIIPRRWLVKTLSLAREVDLLLAQYLRGQLLVMLLLAVYYTIVLTFAGIDVALPVGIITGLLVFIPYLGFGLGLILALIAALLQFNGWYGIGVVAVIYGIGQILESFFLTPRLVGQSIGLHPLAVIFALLAGGQLFGFVGVLLALPISAIISVGLKHLYIYYCNSSFYR